jgi:hypothetical protein
MEKKKLHFAEWSARHVGKSYGLGEADCCNIVLDLCDYLGVPAEEFEGVTRQTYADFYRNDPVGAKATFARWVATVADQVDPAFISTGDLLEATLLHDDDLSHRFIAIYAGGDRILSAFDLKKRGIRTMSIRGYKIIAAYRLRRN